MENLTSFKLKLNKVSFSFFCKIFPLLAAGVVSGADPEPEQLHPIQFYSKTTKGLHLIATMAADDPNFRTIYSVLTRDIIGFRGEINTVKEDRSSDGRIVDWLKKAKIYNAGKNHVGFWFSRINYDYLTDLDGRTCATIRPSKNHLSLKNPAKSFEVEKQIFEGFFPWENPGPEQFRPIQFYVKTEKGLDLIATMAANDQKMRIIYSSKTQKPIGYRGEIETVKEVRSTYGKITERLKKAKLYNAQKKHVGWWLDKIDKFSISFSKSYSIYSSTVTRVPWRRETLKGHGRRIARGTKAITTPRRMEVGAFGNNGLWMSTSNFLSDPPKNTTYNSISATSPIAPKLNLLEFTVNGIKN